MIDTAISNEETEFQRNVALIWRSMFTGMALESESVQMSQVNDHSLPYSNFDHKLIFPQGQRKETERQIKLCLEDPSWQTFLTSVEDMWITKKKA